MPTAAAVVAALSVVAVSAATVSVSDVAVSVSARELFAYFGFTVDKVVEAVNGLLGKD